MPSCTAPMSLSSVDFDSTSLGMLAEMRNCKNRNKVLFPGGSTGEAMVDFTGGCSEVSHLRGKEPEDLFFLAFLSPFLPFVLAFFLSFLSFFLGLFIVFLPFVYWPFCGFVGYF